MPTRRDAIGGLLATAAAPHLRPSLDSRPYAFLYKMMDRYYAGPTLRLVQSFVPTPALDLGDIAFTYDNAVMTIALLARGNPDDVARARVLGDGLAYAQAHDPIGDGRVRSVYYAHPFVKANGRPNFEPGDPFDVGDNAWTGLALMQLYARTGNASYLAAAARTGEWIQANAADARGVGGYTGGLTPGGARIPWKSTEHNLDVYALFTMLANASMDAAWRARAASALAFVDSMWNAGGGFYWIGSVDDGVHVNTMPIPEDVQTWSFLATGRRAYAGSIDWATANLSASGGRFGGVSFSNADRSGVWFEGTAHMAAAYRLAGNPGNANRYLQYCARGVTYGLNGDGLGLDAASKNGLRTGDGDQYFAALHVGATGWYAIAEYGGNPFVIARAPR